MCSFIDVLIALVYLTSRPWDLRFAWTHISVYVVCSGVQIPDDPETLDDEALQELQEELTADFDIGYSIKDSIIPRAVEWWVKFVGSHVHVYVGGSRQVRVCMHQRVCGCVFVCTCMCMS